MNINYRKEIDGLRCLSVVSVIIYHLSINIKEYQFLSGGFLGVDIFFVISGFLITNIFLTEWKQKNKIEIKNFFKRRIRRILPALFFVLITTLIFGWFFLLPASLVELSRTVISTIFFSSNFYFYIYDQSYGTVNSFLIPLLHTWSLSIEEQFYIFYPFLLLVFFKKKKLMVSLIFLFLFLFFLSVFIKLYDWEANFYLIFSRGWELVAGALAAVLKFNNSPITAKISKIKFINHISIFSIILSFFLFDDKLNLPGFLTLFPVVSLIILLINPKKDLITSILSYPVFVNIGLISYSLYLWHYPIFAFNRIIKFSNDNFFLEILIILLLFFLSFLTYRLIENPLRNRNKFSFKFVGIVLITTFVILISFSSIIIKNNGFENRIPELLNHFVDKKDGNYRNFEQNGEKCHNRVGDKGFCKFQVDNPKGEIFLIGDSQTDAMLSSLITLSKNNDYDLTHMSYSGNLFLENFVIRKRKDLTILYDEKRHDYRLQAIKNSKSLNKVIIVNGIYEKYFNDYDTEYKNNKKILVPREDMLIHKNETNFERKNRILKLTRAFENSLNTILNLPNTKVILVYPTPIPYRDLSQDLLNFLNKKRFTMITGEKKNNEDDINNNFIKNFELSKNYFQEINKNVLNIFNKLDHPSLLKIYPSEILCSNSVSKCKIIENNNLIYHDTIHLSHEGSMLINQLIFDKIEVKK